MALKLCGAPADSDTCGCPIGDAHGLPIRAAETIAVDPVTGGQKGQKPERYELIPAAAWDAAARSRSPERYDLPSFLLGCAQDFWEGDSIAGLLRGLREIVFALGGPVAARKHLADVYGKGAIKHGDNNWRKGYRWSWSYAALCRHLEAVRRGELIDPELGTPHYANAWFHFATLWTYATEGLGTDDRPSTVARLAAEAEAARRAMLTVDTIPDQLTGSSNWRTR